MANPPRQLVGELAWWRTYPRVSVQLPAAAPSSDGEAGGTPGRNLRAIRKHPSDRSFLPSLEGTESRPRRGSLPQHCPALPCSALLAEEPQGPGDFLLAGQGAESSLDQNRASPMVPVIVSVTWQARAQQSRPESPHTKREEPGPWAPPGSEAHVTASGGWAGLRPGLGGSLT